MNLYGLSLAAFLLLPVSSMAAQAPSETKESVAETSSIAEKNLMASKQYLEENKQKPGVTTLPSGLQYQILQEGKGTRPGPSDLATVHYKGTLINGTEFDSSYSRGTPATFPVNAVIPGWTEALQLMPTGSKWILTIPPNLAYGTHGAGPKIGPNETLIFEVELLDVKPSNESTRKGLEDADEDGDG